MTQRNYTRYAWGVLAYNLAVILWGAYVRATGSGAGCGNHWPLCDGEVIPRLESVARMIEFTHRLSTGLAGFLILGLLVWALRLYPKGHIARTGAKATFFFTVTEALLGAALVKLELVAQNDSPARAVAMSCHLINTFLLVACLTLTAWWSAENPAPRLRGQGPLGLALGLGIVGLLILGVSGAITALGDTLFPVSSLIEGLRQDFSPTAHFLIRLRILHPLIALSVGLYVLLMAGLATHLRPTVQVKFAARSIGLLFLVEILLGVVNVALHAPVSMQMIHLLVADLTWIAYLLLTATAVAEGVPQRELGVADHSELVTAHQGQGTATWKDYLALTKPRVISLLLFTTLAAMFMAARGWPGMWLFLAVAVGGYMAAGAANAINMVIDRDIDGHMTRTATRPTVTQRISSQNALLFAFGLAIGSFLLLWQVANLLSAMLALAGLVFYVIIYTLGLKRRTWQNIVIGGAAGAFPPLVGWAAVTDELSVLAWYLFAIIFVWTPVHFWALALLLKDDYAQAGVPMLPVVRGVRMTVTQIALYTLLTAIVSILPFLQREFGAIYLVSAILLNLALLLRTFELYRLPERRQASSLFHYSMLYLFLLFLFMAVDRTVFRL